MQVLLRNVMKSIRSHYKKLSGAVALFLLLATILLSVHYHRDIKSAEGDNACSICLIAHSFTNVLSPSGLALLAPESNHKILPVFSLSLNSRENFCSVSIRGPPPHSLV